VNELYSAIQKKKDLKDKIKVIGIGAGNTTFEVDFFQKTNLKFTLGLFL